MSNFMRCHPLAPMVLILFIICLSIGASSSASNKETYYLKGNAFYDQGKYDKAEESYANALSIDENYFEAQKAMCNTKTALHDCDSMSICYKKLFKLDPASKENLDFVTKRLKDASCYRQTQGSDQYNSKLYDTLLEIYNESLSRNINDSNVWNDKGIALGDLNRLEDSLDCFDKAIRINKAFAEAWNNRGVSLDKMDRHQEALENYNKSIEIDPRLAEAWYNKGKTLGLEDASFEEARKCYFKAIEIDPLLKSKSEILDWIYKET
ncbi:Photosystem I assembly protein Ycf3 [uncultured archaeon]|nr:Photosystem I assembly protein Ycf3 [uncultured archaeon]